MADTSLPDPLAGARQALIAGDLDGAMAACRARITAAPAETGPRYLLASALAAAGDVGASAALEEARMLDALLLAGRLGADVARLSRDADYAATVATQLYDTNYVAAASVVYGRAIAAGHVGWPVLMNYALALQHQGRAEEAIPVFRAALELYPSAGLHQFLLYPHFLVRDGLARYAAAARAWAARWAPDGPAPAFANAPLAGRRLRIGYVAPAFGALQVRQFITPILEAHDPAAVDVFLYPITPKYEDAWAKHITVRPLGGVGDVDAAALIRADRIDVLVDCWGHAALGRLGVFAQRAAPVQVSFINWLQTTGLAQMDYVIHGDVMAAPGTAPLFTETVWPLGPVAVPFRPVEGRPAPTPTPALARGQITFGSYNHPAKLSDATVRAWSRILARVPTARLVLKYRYFIDPVLQAATRARFAAERIDPARLVFQGQSEGADYLASFGEIDLALDPSPCPGGTTSCDAISMGVPVLTLAGDGFYARIGVMCLEAVGLPELIADSWDDYVDKAVALAGDLPALDALRAKVRPGFDNSAYRDEAGFTRRLEAALREMYVQRARLVAAA